MIYMDYNATAPMHPTVLSAMHELGTQPLNASALHFYGRRARNLVETARENIAKFAGAGNMKIIFGSCGTECNNMALKGLDKYKILVSRIEHSSVLSACLHDHEILVNSQGLIDVFGLKNLLKQYVGEKVLVSTMLANNETGVVQPISEIAAVVHEHGGILHVDAVQAFGKIPVNMQDLGADMLTISAHKFGGPQGIAALIVAKHVAIKPFIMGGGQERGLRAGTENVAAIHGFGVATSLAADNIAKMQQIEQIRNKIEAKITDLAPDSIIFGRQANRLPNTSMIYMPGVSSHTQLMHFDMEKIAVSNGAACSSGKIENSHVLLSMGVAPEIAACVIRVSLGVDNSLNDAEVFIQAWQKLYERAGLKNVA